jgi:hypothetical protein
MKTEVATSIEELKKQFSDSVVTYREDGQGGAFVRAEPILLGDRYQPTETWVGFHIPAQYPYADIYPVFIGAEVTRVDRKPFAAPVTTGHQFEGLSAIKISRRSPPITIGMQKAVTKILKVIDFLRRLP